MAHAIALTLGYIAYAAILIGVGIAEGKKGR